MNDPTVFAAPRWNWSGVPDSTVIEMSRQAEACLADTVTLGIAADSRAMTLSGIFGGGAVALLAAVAALFVDDNVNWSLVCSAAAAASTLLLAAFFTAFSARPTDFHTCGYDPEDLLVMARNEQLSYHLIEDLQDRIDHNRKVLKANGQFLTEGLYLSVASIPVAVVAFFLPIWFS